MLVDGGIANNLPMNVAQEMGADILIVVDIGTPLRTREKLTSLAGITAQVMTILIQRNVAAQLRTLQTQDILLQPDLGDVGTTDFSQTKQALMIGRNAAQAIKDRIARLSVSDDDYKKYLALQRQTAQELPVIDYVRVEQPKSKKLSPNVLAAKVETRPGDKLDLKKSSTGTSPGSMVSIHLKWLTSASREKTKSRGLSMNRSINRGGRRMSGLPSVGPTISRARILTPWVRASLRRRSMHSALNGAISFSWATGCDYSLNFTSRWISPAATLSPRRFPMRNVMSISIKWGAKGTLQPNIA